MSNRLGGRQGTAYVGTNAVQPPDYTFSDRSPNQYDVNNVSVGDFWLNQTDESLWVLVSLAGDSTSRGSLATWSKLEAGGISALNALTGNTGGVVNPDGSANINIVGDGIGITITGNPGTNTLTASLIGGGTPAESFPTDVGTAIPVLGVLNIKADTAGINAGSTVSFSGTGNTVTFNVTDANDNTIIGKASGSGFITGGDNTILGHGSGVALTSGDDNTIIGGTAGSSITVGSNNIILGSGAASALTVSDSDNTIIGGTGFAGANEFVVVTAGASGSPVFHNYPGVNASTTNGGNTFVGANAGNFTLAGGAGNASNNAFGDGALGALTSAANNNAIGAFALSKVTTGSNNIAVGHNAGFNSGGNTGIITGEFNILVGYTAGDAYTGAESSNIIIGDVPGTVAESNVLRIAAGTGAGAGQLNKAFISGIYGIAPAAAIPVFINTSGQLGTVGSGGSSLVSTLTGNSGGAVSPAAGNITFVGDGTSINIVGNPGTNTLTVSAIGGPGGLSTLTGDTGGAISPTAGTINVIADHAGINAGSSVLFSGAGSTLTLNVTDASNNTLVGFGAGNLTLSGSNNTGFGLETLAGLTSGTFNTVLGVNAGDGLTTGSFNIIVGSDAGSNYTSLESNNILIGSAGVITETHALRIGDGTGAGLGQINKSFISGIRGITPATADGIPVFIGSAGQLGTVGTGGSTFVSTISGDGSVAVSPLLGNINIVGDGATAAVTANPGTHTLTISAIGGGGGTLNDLVGDDSVVVVPIAGMINVITGNASQDCGSSVAFDGSGNTLQLSVTDSGDNTIIGFGAGNATLSGTNNIALGGGSAVALTTGSKNIFLGVQAGNLITTGSGNFLAGDASTATVLKGTTTSTGLYGFGIGGEVFLHNYGGTASGNTSIGAGASGSFNAGQVGSGRNNTACGAGSLFSVTTGTGNTILGYVAGASITTGANNTLLGVSAGSNYTSSESSNICIGLATTGTAAESNVLRIGAATGTGAGQVNKAFVSGIRGITPTTNDGIPVFINSVGQLGTVGTGGSTLISSLTGNSGGAVGPASGNINVRGDGTSITVVGNPGTNTLTISAVGGGGGLTTLTGDNSSATEVAGVINVIAGTSSQDCGSSVAFDGSGNTLQLSVTDSGDNTLIGFHVGNATLAGSNNTALGSQCGRLLTTGSKNIFLGVQAGSLVTTGTGNFLAGDASLATILKGTTTSTGFYGFGIANNVFLHNWGGNASGNTFVGASSGGSFNVGQQVNSASNTACGAGSLFTITTGKFNTAIGFAAGNSLSSGQNNTLLGLTAGTNYSSSESSNICIGSGTTGTVAENNTMRIGTGTGTGAGQINRAFIAGIRGITTGISNAIPVVIDSAGQLGTAGGSGVITTVTGNSGGAVSATGGNINVRGDGVSVNVSGNPGTSTLTISAVGGAGGPLFSVYKNSDSTVSTNTIPQVTFDIVTSNVGSAFNIGTSTFTAPVTGLYNLSCSVGYNFTSTVGVTKGSISILTSNFQYIITSGSYLNMKLTPSSSNTDLTMGNNVYTQMTAGDTAKVFTSVTTTGSGQTYKILGSIITGGTPALVTYFGGSLV